MRLLAEGTSGPFDVFKACLILITSLVALFVVVSVIRKRIKSDDTSTGGGFTLADLRDLHKQGKMTNEEYEKAKAILVASLARPAKRTTETKPPGQPGV